MPMCISVRSQSIAHSLRYGGSLGVLTTMRRVADYEGLFSEARGSVTLSASLYVVHFGKCPKRKTFRRLRFVEGVRLQKERDDHAFSEGRQFCRPHVEL